MALLFYLPLSFASSLTNCKHLLIITQMDCSAKKILIVDDDKMMLESFREVLRSNGFNTMEALSGQIAIELFHQCTPDVVILDLNMPDMDGIETMQRLREITPGIPIIILTGYGDIPTAVEAMKCGANNFVQKSGDFDDLMTVIENIIENNLKKLPFLPLSPRQAEVLKLTANGKSSSEIAAMLDLSEDTVNFHINKARRKLTATNKAHAVAKAIQLGLIEPEQNA